MRDNFIHHETFQPEWGQEDDGYDVIETDDGFTVWHHSVALHEAHYLSDALAEAERLANEFDRLWLEDREASREADRAFQESLDRAVLANHDAPEEWLVVVTDADGDRILSETFAADRDMGEIREQVLRHFDPPPGHTIRFHPIGPERIDLALGIA